MFSFSGCRVINALGGYSKVRAEAQEAASRGCAGIIAAAFNTNNALSDEEDRLTKVPETIDEFNEWATALPITMEEDYNKALPYIYYDEDGDAKVKDKQN